MDNSNNWRVSLHGGHSGEFCDHGEGTLKQMVEAAIRFGYRTFGVTEHAPRSEARFLFPEEIARGWDVAKITADFDRYAKTLDTLIREFSGQIEILRGFEAEVVPSDHYAAEMNALRRKYGFEYVVGSVHWVNDIIIDYNEAEFKRAVETCGSVELLAIRYYETLADMVRALRPEVVGHLDVFRKFTKPSDSINTPRIRDAAQAALETIRAHGCILDVNVAPLRRGQSETFPTRWLIRAAKALGISFCFGDDSHTPEQVGKALEQARTILLEEGVHAITRLTRHEGRLIHETVALDCEE